MRLEGTPTMVESIFVNQLKTLPVRLGAQRADRSDDRSTGAREPTRLE